MRHSFALVLLSLLLERGHSVTLLRLFATLFAASPFPSSPSRVYLQATFLSRPACPSVQSASLIPMPCLWPGSSEQLNSRRLVERKYPPVPSTSNSFPSSAAHYPPESAQWTVPDSRHPKYEMSGPRLVRLIGELTSSPRNTFFFTFLSFDDAS